MPSQLDRDARIRDRAYRIWDREARPHGQDEAHWRQAEREIAAEEADAAGSPREKKATVACEPDPPTGSRARANDEAAAKKPRTRAAAAAHADASSTGGQPKATPRRRDKATT